MSTETQVTKITVLKDVVKILDMELPENVLVTLVEVCSMDEKPVAIGPDQKGKAFQASFDKSKSDNELIFQWKSEFAEDQPAIKIKGIIRKDEKSISITGEGFETVVIEITESPVEADGVGSK